MGGKADFGVWLQGQLDNRGWNQARLSRKSGISPAQIARVINNVRDPGHEFCRAIAKALDLPEELVFRQAGLLSPEGKKENPPNLAEWVHIFIQANPERREEMLELARFFSRKK